MLSNNLVGVNQGLQRNLGLRQVESVIGETSAQVLLMHKCPLRHSFLPFLPVQIDFCLQQNQAPLHKILPEHFCIVLLRGKIKI
jgi:hypothetical protein